MHQNPNEDPQQSVVEDETEQRPVYTPPAMRTYTAEELLAALGPAQAGSVGGQNVFGQW